MNDNTLPDVRSLTIHADYRCRHSGLCCSSDWDVPVEAPVYRSLDAALNSGRLRLADGSESLGAFIVEPDLPEEAAAMLERNHHGQCVFLDPASRLCVVHRDLGESALPATCRHFPRLAVHDGRGIAIGLSHYCPTAAGMLFRDDVPLAVVTAPTAFPWAEYEGLTVTADDLPPLLKPGVVMDLAAYDAWERHMVSRCAAAPNAESAVATLARDAGLLRAWVPDGPSMLRIIEQLPPGSVIASCPDRLDESLMFHRRAMRVVPDDLRPEADEEGLCEAYAEWVGVTWPDWARPLTRYVATKAFASWTAYQGHGVLSIVEGLSAALALVRVEASRRCRDARRPLDRSLLLAAFQQADFILNHLAVGEDLALDWSKVEAG